MSSFFKNSKCDLAVVHKTTAYITSCFWKESDLASFRRLLASVFIFYSLASILISDSHYCCPRLFQQPPKWFPISLQPNLFYLLLLRLIILNLTLGSFQPVGLIHSLLSMAPLPSPLPGFTLGDCLCRICAPATLCILSEPSSHF